ncbi:hypothetical protein PanWU01x14_198900, partial [Parasponia andersonii]
KFGPTITIRVHHVKGLRVTAPHDSLKPRPHIEQLALGLSTLLLPVVHHRDHPGADRHTPDHPQHVRVRLPARAGHRVAAPPSVAVHRPRGLLKELPSAAVRRGRYFLRLERNPYEPRGHLLDQGSRRHRQLQDQNGFGSGFELHCEADVAAAVAEEGSGDFPAERRGYGELGWDGEPFTGGEYGRKGENVEERPENGGELNVGLGKIVVGHRRVAVVPASGEKIVGDSVGFRR